MQDWILNKNAAPAVISEQNGTITLNNGLVRRVIETDGCRTVSLYNNQKEIELISAPRADFAVVVGIKIYEADAFDFISYQITTCEERIPFQKSATMTFEGTYPPPGKAVELLFKGKDVPLAVTVRYEIYDGMPVIMKRLTVRNTADHALTLENIMTDVLTVKENRDMLFVDSDYDSTTQFYGLELSKYAKHYARYHYDILEVAPRFRMNQKLEAGVYGIPIPDTDFAQLPTGQMGRTYTLQ